MLVAQAQVMRSPMAGVGDAGHRVRRGAIALPPLVETEIGEVIEPDCLTERPEPGVEVTGAAGGVDRLGRLLGQSGGAGVRGERGGGQSVWHGRPDPVITGGTYWDDL